MVSGAAAKSTRFNKPRANSPPLPATTFVIDNGAHTMKAGYAVADTEGASETKRDIAGQDGAQQDDQTSSSPPCSVIPNALARTRDKHIFTGLDIATQITDWNEVTFRRPVERGYLVNWEAQRDIWEYSFFDAKTTARYKDQRLHIPYPSETTLILTEAPNTMAALEKNTDEIIMEEWGFGGYVRCVGPTLNAWNEVHGLFGDPVDISASASPLPLDCLLVIDCGYSHTTVTPVYHGRPLQRGIRRLDLGGKALTNYLKELVSVRQYHMLDETHIINEVKEAACFVSGDMALDMERTWKGNPHRPTTADESIVVDYVLPDPVTRAKGFMRPHDTVSATKKRKEMISAPASMSEDVLVLGNERFTVPETLFNPTDIGLQSPGIPEMVMQSLSVLPAGLHPAFLANILVVGGSSLMSGFMERLYVAVRKYYIYHQVVFALLSGIVNSKSYDDL